MPASAWHGGRNLQDLWESAGQQSTGAAAGCPGSHSHADHSCVQACSWPTAACILCLCIGRRAEGIALSSSCSVDVCKLVAASLSQTHGPARLVPCTCRTGALVQPFHCVHRGSLCWTAIYLWQLELQDRVIILSGRRQTARLGTAGRACMVEAPVLLGLCLAASVWSTGRTRLAARVCGCAIWAGQQQGSFESHTPSSAAGDGLWSHRAGADLRQTKSIFEWPIMHASVPPFPLRGDIIERCWGAGRHAVIQPDQTAASSS